MPLATDAAQHACLGRLAPALGTKADSSWIMTATLDQPENSVRGRCVTQKELTKPGSQQPPVCPRAGQRGRLLDTRVQGLGGSLN